MFKTDAIRQAYIAPIRTVTLVDDEFPTYGDLTRSSMMPGAEDIAAEPVAAQPGVQEHQRARSLWDSYRKRGWVCDIENNWNLDNTALSHIAKSDLIILDYHLAPSENIDPTLKILRFLADSPHSHLVVLYTNVSDLNAVQRQIGASLRGAKAAEEVLSQELLSTWYGLEDWPPEIDSGTIDAFLRGGRWVKSATELTSALERAGVSKQHLTQFATATLERVLQDSFLGGRSSGLRSEVLKLSPAGASNPWMAQGNLFLALVHKEKESKNDESSEGDRVIDALEKALIDSKPLPLQLTLAFARSAVARGGFRAESLVLRDPVRHAGWWYQLLQGGEEIQRRTRTLFQRLLESFSDVVLSEIESYADSLSDEGSLDGSKPLEMARELAGLGTKVQPWEVVHALNEFLCSEQFTGTHIRTGTVFREISNPDRLWICATPECDMVPRPPSDPWRAKLHPVRPMWVLQVDVSKASETTLRQAEKGSHLFVTIDGKRLEIRIPDGTTGKPRLEMMLAANQAITDASRRFTAYRLVNQPSDGSKEPISLEPSKFEACAQIRTTYASRWLHEAGVHLSRIGVDFVDFPEF